MKTLHDVARDGTKAKSKIVTGRTCHDLHSHRLNTLTYAELYKSLPAVSVRLVIKGRTVRQMHDAAMFQVTRDLPPLQAAPVRWALSRMMEEYPRTVEQWLSEARYIVHIVEIQGEG